MKVSHIAWNLTGLAMPLAIAALTVPALVSKLGQERFGILALAWGLIGYAGALDLGIGRALTQKIGNLLGKGELNLIAPFVATASRITLISGLVGCALIFLAALFGASNLVRITTVEKEELRLCIFLLAIALPAQAMSATYKGVNEAFLNFRSISLLRASLGAMNFGGPYLISLFSIKLTWIIGSLVLTRLIALLVYKKLAIKCLPANSEKNYKYSSKFARSLFSFGAWLTVSSIVSPILVQADRFVIASTISAAAVYVYVLPYEVVVQSLVLVGAVSSVIFPNLARLVHESPESANLYFKKWLSRISFLMAIVCSLIALTLPIILPIWIKDGFNKESIIVGQILCLGVFANSLGSMYYAFLHAKGRADVTAKIHILEIPVFLLILVYLTDRFGVQGAAWAWASRMVVDCMALSALKMKIRRIESFK